MFFEVKLDFFSQVKVAALLKMLKQESLLAMSMQLKFLVSFFIESTWLISPKKDFNRAPTISS